jgi:hypothetical protein
VAIPPTSNGIVLFTSAGRAIKWPLDMHPKHVEDECMTMEFADTMILMAMMMETSLENADLHMLFTFIYFQVIQKSNDLSMPRHFFFFSLNSTKRTLLMMFLPPTSILKPVIHLFANKFYPPPTLVKHHIWFLPVTDLFISLNGVLYGVHQSYFKQSPLFQEILQYGEDEEIGTNPNYPIPFDTLKKEIFNDFLHLLYFGIERLEYLNRENWVNIKRLSMDWHFPHITALII